MRGPQLDSGWTSSRAQHVASAIVALAVASGLLFSFYNSFWYPPDEGNYAHVAQRVMQGEILNLDVQDVHPGYIMFLHAGALRVFGLDLLSLRYPLVAAELLQAVALLVVFRREKAWL